MNSSDQSQKAKDIFAEALAWTSLTERRAYLERACAGNPALRAEVESLLRAHDQAGGFLQPPVSASAAQDTMLIPRLTEMTGTRIGRYKLLERIGEGGMGVVWMAEQEEPVRRRVALKIIKLGMDTKEVVARFEAERQALAMMDHLNIASVFDGGATETGRPYFVMELVKGIPITDYCNAKKLSTPDRLRMFMQVCQAVQHAHQKGVIHRDLKPSNILVTVKDDQPLPKVIDFGVAKSTLARLTEKTFFTQFHQLIGTPAYMSPEQAGLGSLDVDTRSDIYALGVLLYELLTDRTPFDTQKLLERGYDAILRAIREEEPPKPSTRLSTMQAGELTATAQNRQADPPKLIHLIRGDLDWIVMKTLEKDRTRRYETVNGLAMEIQRHLNSEPVVARPPSNLDRFQKWVRRHRVAVAAATAVLVALVAGGLVSSLEAVRARRAEGAQTRLRETAVEASAAEAKARSLAEQRLYEARLSEARAKRLSGLSGQRFESLAAIAEAATLHRTPELSDEAMACLALTDLRVLKTYQFSSPSVAEQAQFDDQLGRYACETNGGISVRYAANNEQTLFLPVEGAAASDAGLSWLRFDPRGRYLSAKADRGDRQGHWLIWNLNRNGALALDVKGDCMNFSPDGRTLAIANDNLTISVQNLDSSSEPKRFSVGVRLSHIEFSPDGAMVAGFQDENSSLWVWAVASGQLLAECRNSDGINSMAWSPHGSLIALGDTSGGINLWNVRQEEVRLRLQGHHRRVVGLAFSHRGNLLASVGWDATTRLWDVASGQCLVVYPGAVEGIQFSPDDRTLASAYDGVNGRRVLEIARPAGYQRLASRLKNKDCEDVDFTPDGRLAAVCTGRALLMDVFTGQELGFLGQEASRSVHFDPASPSALWSATHTGLYRWPLRFGSNAGRSMLRVGPPECLLNDEVFGPFAFDRNGTRVALTRERHDGVLLLDLQHPAAPTKFCSLPGAEFTAADPAGAWVAAGTWKGNGVSVWDFSTGRLIRSLAVTGSAHIAASPDGKWLVTANSNEFRLWDTKSWSLVRETLPAYPIWTMTFSPDSRLLATCHGPGEIWLFRVPTFQTVARFLLPTGSTISALHFSPSGDKLAALEWNGVLHFWNLPVMRSELEKLGLDWDLPSIAPASGMPPAVGPEWQLDAGPFSQQELAEAIPARDTNAPANLIDLTDYYNAPLTASWADTPDKHNDLSTLPGGLQSFAGVQFDVRGLIQLGARAANGLYCPASVTSIPIGQSCQRLHFLHAAVNVYGNHDREQLGKYVIHYVDGMQVEIPIVVGKDLADWWSQSNEENMKATIAWSGNNTAALGEGHSIRLFKTTWDNPYPAVRIRQFDFLAKESANGDPFLVALTVDP